MVIVSLTLFLLGLAIGSFLNVVICRYQPDKFLFGKLLGGRSFCPQCRKKLKWYELAPVISFIFQFARCRDCKKPISWQYPLVELLTGSAFLLPVYFYNYFKIPQHILAGDLLVWYYWFAGAWVLASILFIVLAFIDWQTFIIPDETVIGISLLGLLTAALRAYYPEMFSWQISFLGHYAPLFELPFSIFWNNILAGAIGFLFFGGIFLLTMGRGMGFGDVKLAGAIGLLLGWPDAVLVLALSFLIGSVWGLIVAFQKRKLFKQPIPFGPSLVLATYVVVFFGFQIVDWYFKLFGII
jgi:prepilin signal peptidase PulO-like enzyme (type II secretory pathway)